MTDKDDRPATPIPSIEDIVGIAPGMGWKRDGEDEEDTPTKEPLNPMADQYCAEHNLTPDEAIEHILAKVRHQPLSPALAAKVAGTGLDAEARTFALAYKLTPGEGGWAAKDSEDLGVMGTGATEERAVRMFLWDFRDCLVNLTDPDIPLTETGRRRRAILLAKFGLVDEEERV